MSPQGLATRRPSEQRVNGTGRLTNARFLIFEWWVSLVRGAGL